MKEASRLLVTLIIRSLGPLILTPGSHYEVIDRTVAAPQAGRAGEGAGDEVHGGPSGFFDGTPRCQACG